jgi:polyphosphate:AMP phosphotransferase
MFLGSWYTKPAQQAVTGKMDMGDFDQHLQEIESFERTLTDDGALVIKLWLHVSEKQQIRRLAENMPREQHNLRRSDQPYELQGKYNEALAVSERMILATDTSHSHWQLIEACDPRYRDIAAGEYILKAMQDRTAQQPAVDEPAPELPATEVPAENLEAQPTVLDKVDLSLALDGEKYKRKLDRYQNRLQELGWLAYQQKRSVVAVFEGWDAAGKGSAIRRVTQAMDPRLYRLLQFAAPTDEERAQHYLWRFWRQMQRDGRCTFFDRSWYGRVLVERVEQLATRPQWQRAYSEINQFEQQLVNHGCIVLKFWLHISPDEQERRFRAREQEPRKRYKLTEEDWRNRAKWPEYEIAVDQMVGHTSTTHAPWTLVSGNDKKNARVEILKTFCKTMSLALES